MSDDPDPPAYGTGDTTFQAAGGEAGIRALVEDFYDIMGSNPAYQQIFAWHPADIDVSIDKLARFLCGWMGGPRRYTERYGRISIPGAHAHLNVTPAQRDQWLDCMREALERQPYPAALKTYLIEQLAVPAEAVHRVSQAQR